MSKNFIGTLMAAYMVLAVGTSLQAHSVSVPTVYGQDFSASTRLALDSTDNPGTGNSNSEILFGDVNNSGSVSAADVLLINAHIAGTRLLTGDALVRADINEDGLVNSVDSYLGMNLIVGNISQASSDRKMLFGDINFDGQVNITDVVMLVAHLSPSNALTGKAAIAADADISGTINTADVYLLQADSVGLITKLPTKFGDLNGDFKVNLSDVVLATRGVSNTTTLTPSQSALANVYRGSTLSTGVSSDSTVDSRDVELLRKYIVGSIPSLPITIGDVNNDGAINVLDSTLISRFVNNLQTPTATQLVSGDVDANGTINAFDLSLLNQFIVGSIQAIPVNSSSASPAPAASNKSAFIAFYDRATYRMIPNSTISLYLNPAGTLIGTQPAPNGYATFSNLNVGSYTARASAPGYNNGTGGFNISATSPDVTRLNIFTDRSSQQSVCSDGIDNDNDGLIDYPNDPGCVNGTDNDENPRLTVNVVGSGTVLSSPAGITCGADCIEHYSSNTVVTLTANNSSGYVFSGWSGACSGANVVCQVTMNTSKTAIATFTQVGGDQAYLGVSGGTQPANSIAPQGATRVPFTRIVLTANGANATVNNLVIERMGLANDQALASAIVLDESGNQIGTTKTLNSSHQAILDAGFTIPAGTSRTLTIVGNMTNNLAPYSGQMMALSLVAINTSSEVRGTLPITGAYHTLNSTLQIGAVSMSLGATDPNAPVSRIPGAVNNVFSTVRITANNLEDLRLKSVRWHALGTALASQVINERAVVNGVPYNVIPATDSRFREINFGSGIVVPRGSYVDVEFQGTIPGNDPVGITREYDLYAPTEVYLTGETFGYGVPVTTGGNARSGATTASEYVTSDGTVNGVPATPWFSGSVTTINSSSGSLWIFTSSNSPAYTQVQANSTNVVAGIYKFMASDEDINLQQLSVQLTSGSPSSVSRVTVWDGSVMVGSGIFIGDNTTSNITLSPAVLIQRGSDKNLTIKVDLSQVGTGYAGIEGDYIAVNTNHIDRTATYGVGLTSGTRIIASGGSDVAGIRMYKSIPVFSQDTLPTSGLSDGRLMRFRVSAGTNGSISMDKYSLRITPGGVLVSSVNIYAYTDSSYSVPLSGVGPGGKMMASDQTPNANGYVEIYSQNSSGAPAPVVIPEGSTRYFEVRAVVSGMGYATTNLLGDSAYPVLSSPMGSVAQIDADTNDNVIWSPNRNGSSSQADFDWTNAFGAVGLPWNGFVFTRSN